MRSWCRYLRGEMPMDSRKARLSERWLILAAAAIPDTVIGFLNCSQNSMAWRSALRRRVGVVQWASVSNRQYNVLWADTLNSRFRVMEPGIAFPQNSFTDTNNTGAPVQAPISMARLLMLF